MDKKKVLIGIFDYVVITIGTVLFVMAWTSFLLPNNMIDGGLTGASALLAMVTGVSVDVWYFSVNVLLLILALFVLGQGFGIKTVYAIVLSTLLFRFLGNESLRCLWSVEGEILYVGDGLLVPIIGGLLEAIGLSMIIIRGGSTGGTDILALIVNKSPSAGFIFSRILSSLPSLSLCRVTVSRMWCTVMLPWACVPMCWT